MEKEAGDWAKGCRFEHQMKGRGENLAFQTFNKDPDYKTMLDKAMKGWYDEINMYSYSGKSCHASCHYTQVSCHVTCIVTSESPVMLAAIEVIFYVNCWLII